MVLLKWDKKLKDKHGWKQAKELYIRDKACLNKKCFQPHDWNRDGHLICAVNGRSGCPPGEQQ